MPVSKVQLFAYEVDTHNPNRINAILRRTGAEPDEMSEERYFHLQANLQRDLIKAGVLPLVEDGTLPVFMAPEFFFKWRDGLPYSRETFFNAMPYLESLSAAFGPVLWVVGTVWWQERQDATHARVHNSVLIFQHGRLLHSWQKERLSGIDGLNQGPEMWDRHDLESQRILDRTQTPFFDAAVPGGGTVHCGIEVCLDHLSLKDPFRPGVLRTAYLAAHPDPTEGAGVDLHLMVAAGMGAQLENIVAKSGGAYFRCDGGEGADPRSNSVAVTREGPTPPAALRLWDADGLMGKPYPLGTDTDERLVIYPAIGIV